MSEDISELVEHLANGRVLSPFDMEAMQTVAGLIMRLRSARAAIVASGGQIIVDDGKGFPVEHPALLVEKRASAELRGWVKDRPDLFGAPKVAESDSGVDPMAEFRRQLEQL